MDHSLFVLELKEWLEKQLERPHALTIDLVAEKAGYSKWHLQRVFRDVTGENLGV
jgi:AraC family transcriptional regulator, mar-sox-rob regulon activator